MSTLKIYGVPLSQPCRAIIWVCLYKRLKFELVLVNPGSKGKDKSGNFGSRHPDYLAINPSGTIPAIDDGGFTLWESNAILTYLAQKYGWDDLYPSGDLQTRSRIDQYLHWHHRNLRECSVRLVAPNFRKDLKFPPGHVEQGMAIVTASIRVLENDWLAKHRYMVGPSLTLADFACYMEIGQICSRFGNIFDFAEYPNVRRWLEDMAAVPFFDEANKANQIIGDLNNGVVKETIVKANKEGFAVVQAALSKM